ncbi:DUF6443 domain-containing protein [Flavobacteriaceae bacterium S356]|uniref:DUF6443 domain-containing protein n=1 Tax=Asprobacillus argus TaxID=3076534 RepID=A0ABU3LDH0_9FLAO|nr:DUF6443 domain-containing protein [Flavobacteriaceae bacterium S356]
MKTTIKKYIVGAMVAMLPIALSAQTQTENHIVNKVYKKATTTAVITKDKDSVATSITYFDGLGRPIQSIAVQAGGMLTHRNGLLYDWSLGNTGSTPFYNQNGDTSENQIVNGTTPFGDTDLLWECKDDSNGNSSGDGGWSTQDISIDHTKPYRYTTWVKRTGNLSDGGVYHGTKKVNNLDGTPNPNPYFWYGDLPQLDTWYLLVGYIHPSDYTGADIGISGVYDIQGTKVLDGTEFKWDTTTSTTARFRNLMFYTTDPNTRQYFWSPLVQKIDGNELPFDQVINTPIVVISEETANDIVTLIEYDTYGRQLKEYLPYASGYTDGRINSNAILKNQEYYLAKHAADFVGITDPTQVNSYSEKTLENSPLGRIFEQTAPGKDWKKGTGTITGKGYSDGHSIRFEYDTNTATEVKLYDVSLSFANNTYTPTLTGGSAHYPLGELTKTVTKDENWEVADGVNHTTEEFKDKNGQVLLKRTYNNSQPHDTYYVYDDYGNLTYVLPPKAEGSIGIPTSTVLSELCYQYKYDHRNRLVEKKIPGKGWEYIVYDKLDRPVMTQDAVQASNNEWLFTKYDILGRVVYTGVYDHGSTSTRTAMQSSFSSQNDAVFDQYETKVSSGTGVDNSYYSNANFPTSNVELLTVNYYDDYVFDLAGGTAPVSVYTIAPTTNTKSLATGSKVKVLGTSNWITTVSYYDEKARPIYVYSNNTYLGATDIVESKLDDFTGKVLETKSTHQKTGNTDVVTIDRFEYDHMDRLISQTQKINTNPSERLVQNHYDELGQLENKLVGNGTQQSGHEDVTSGINISGNTITKTSADGWNEGLATLGTIQKDGFISFEITQTNIHFMVGLSASNTDASYSSIDYAIYSNARNVSVYEKGVHKGTFDRYAIGDVFKVRRSQNTIYYLWNDEVFYVSTVSSSDTLLGDISMYTQNGSFTNLELVDNSKGLQKVDFTYNVRGWLKNINSDADNDNDLFNFNLKYNDIADASKKLFNGNISQTRWKTANDNKERFYTYNYDALNRITEANYDAIDNTETNWFRVFDISYDKNGNLNLLKRHKKGSMNQSVALDYLSYSYDAGNRLEKVDELIPGAGSFEDGSNTGNDYSYDVNGNMIADKNKDITNIEYNHLNLPTKVVFNNNDPLFSQNPEAIEYVYDATGMKLKKTVKDGVKLATTDYAGNHIYENDVLQFFNHAEGYVNVLPPKTQGGPMVFRSVYQYKDHLGNVRLSYADTNNDGVISTGAVSTVHESDFDGTTDVTPWRKSFGDETLAIDNDRLKCTIDQNLKGTYINMNLEAGKTYQVTYTVDLSATNLEFMANVYGPTELYNSGYFTQGGTFTFTFTAAATVQYKLRFYGKDTAVANGVTYSTPQDFYIDNVSVYEFDASTTEIIEESNYYPFGLKHKGYNNVVSSNGNSVAQRWKFGGKEYNEELGLDWYDISARNYDPAIGRWMNLDPLAEEMRRHSPYNYAFNNPVYFIDYDGMAPSGPEDPNRPVNDKTTTTSGKVNYSKTVNYRGYGGSSYNPKYVKNWAGGGSWMHSHTYLTENSSFAGTKTTNYSTTKSKLSGFQQLLVKEGSGMPNPVDWSDSASRSVEDISGQFYDADGNELDSAEGASSLIVTENSVTESVEFDGQLNLSETATVETTKSVTTYGIRTNKAGKKELINAKNESTSTIKTINFDDATKAFRKYAQRRLNNNHQLYGETKEAFKNKTRETLDKLKDD